MSESQTYEVRRKATGEKIGTWIGELDASLTASRPEFEWIPLPATTSEMSATDWLIWLVEFGATEERVIEGYRKHRGDLGVAWEAVNRAIIRRWSKTALRRIKAAAWAEEVAGDAASE